MCKLHKAIFGLKQSPKAGKFNEVVLQFGL